MRTFCMAAIAILLILPAHGVSQTSLSIRQLASTKSVQGTILVWDANGRAYFAELGTGLVLTIENGKATISVSLPAPSKEIWGEDISTTSALAFTPVAGSVRIVRNGLRQKESLDYTLSGKTITWVLPVEARDVLLADYRTTEQP